MTDGELLRRYAQGSRDAEDAFATLVRLHADWVYAVARRRVGNRELAQDVAQAAFIVLAQKGRTLPPTTPLAPWLFRVTCFAASRALRDEARRKRHEAQLAEMTSASSSSSSHHADDGDALHFEELAPVLDRAVEGLSGSDRHAVLLRFYQRLPLAEVGRSLGISEDAARKRVARAVERLRHRFARLGVRPAYVAPAGLAGVLLEGLAEAAAATHAQAWAAAASAGAKGATATSNELAKGAIEMIVWNKTQAAVAAVLAMAVVIGGVGAAVHAVAAQQPRARSVALAAAPAAAPATTAPPAVETIETQNLLVAVSPDKKELAAFAMATGEWQPLPAPHAPPRAAGERPAPGAGAAAAAATAENIRTDRIVLAAYVGTYHDGRRAYGFSGITGRWDSVAVTDPAVAGSPILVAQNIAACPDGQRVHGFSATTGTWDTLTLPPDGGRPDVAVNSRDTITVRHGKTFHIFSAKTGKWTQPPFQEKE